MPSMLGRQAGDRKEGVVKKMPGGRGKQADSMGRWRQAGIAGGRKTAGLTGIPGIMVLPHCLSKASVLVVPKRANLHHPTRIHMQHAPAMAAAPHCLVLFVNGRVEHRRRFGCGWWQACQEAGLGGRHA